MKRTLLQRKTPLVANAGLKGGQAIKRKSKPAKPKADRDHMARVAAMACIACKRAGPSTVHHVTSDGLKRISRSDQRVVPLCPPCHQIQWGPRDSVEALGHRAFGEKWGINLLAEADRLWSERR